MKKNKRKILVVILAAVAIVSFIFVYNKLFQDNKKPVLGEIKKEDEIKKNEFDYVLYGHKSDLYKECFGKLKEVLLEDEINEEEYSKILSELFVIDFYSLDDKTTNTDIGGLDFIYEEMKDNFVLKATDTIYKNVESNVYGDRNQTLPKISRVEINSIKKEKIEIEDVEDENGYIVIVNVSYEKDLGYPKTVTLTLIHQESKLYIVEVK